MFKTVAFLLCLFGVVNAHFRLLYPGPRGIFVANTEPNFCGTSLRVVYHLAVIDGKLQVAIMRSRRTERLSLSQVVSSRSVLAISPGQVCAFSFSFIPQHILIEVDE